MLNSVEKEFEHCKNTHEGSFFETPCTIVERGTVYYVLWIYIQTTNGKIFKPEMPLLAIQFSWPILGHITHYH